MIFIDEDVFISTFSVFDNKHNIYLKNIIYCYIQLFKILIIDKCSIIVLESIFVENFGHLNKLIQLTEF